MAKRKPRPVTSAEIRAAVVELEIKLESPGGRGQGVSLKRFEKSPLRDGWVDFSIPLKKYKKPDLSEVVIIGQQENAQISIASFADMMNHLNYEVLVRIPSELPRVVVS